MERQVAGVTLRTEGGVKGVSTAADPKADGPPARFVSTVQE
jgi:hypothetical protein